MTSKVDMRTTEEKRRAFERTSYWLPEFAPKMSQGPKVKKPPKRPPSPMTGKPLRMKHLIPVSLCKDPENPERFIDPVSKKRISTQPCVLVKPTGYVVLESVFDRLKKSRGKDETPTCPVTGEEIDLNSDVLRLVRSGSSFASSGTVVAKKWAPSL
eukprot:g4330.t1